jgi:hypothetical protein
LRTIFAIINHLLKLSVKNKEASTSSIDDIN